MNTLNNAGVGPTYTKVHYWVKNYGAPGVEDLRAVHDFVIVEPNEAIASLRAELVGMSKGNYRDDVLDKLIGGGRRSRYGSYAEWAKLMILWMASVRT